MQFNTQTTARKNNTQLLNDRKILIFLPVVIKEKKPSATKHQYIFLTG